MTEDTEEIIFSLVQIFVSLCCSFTSVAQKLVDKKAKDSLMEKVLSVRT